MSWDVRDDVWLAPIEPPAEAPVFDELDSRVVSALTVPTREGPRVPPPPPSAAFDASGRPTSYESNQFMASAQPETAPEPEPEPAGFVIPNLARPSEAPAPPAAVEDVEEEAASDEPESEPEPMFVIPTLRRAETPTAPGSPPPPPAPQAAAGELFIPSLRRAEPPPSDRLDVELVGPHEEVEEVHDVEEIHEQPVRTGDTVIAPAPTAPPVQEFGVASPIVAHSENIGDAVYDDDDDAQTEVPATGEDASPELIDPVDSAELEMVPDEGGEAWTEDDAEQAEEPQGYVIPPLSSPVGGITPAEIVLPMLARAEPERASGDAEQEEEEERVVQPGGDAEDLEEVEELEVEDTPARPPPPIVVEEDAPEARPPSPPPNTAERRRKAWYDDVFAEHYQFLYPPTLEETARRDAEFIHASLGLPAGATVLDVGCGDGRHALELGKLGLRVTGLDNSLALLLAAAQHKEQMGIDDQVSFLHGDMRRLPRDRQFDAVICVGSTLGYFEEDQNRHCLDQMLERLTPTGRLMLHVFNRDFVAPQLPARSWWQGRRCMVLDEAEMNFFANRLRVHRTIIFDDGRQFEHYMFMRAFTIHDLGKTLSQMGMRVVEVSGSRDTRKRFYGAGSPDIWIVAERKT